MALENLKENIWMEKGLIREIVIMNSQLYHADKIERELLMKTLKSCIERLRMINNSIPQILDAISPFRKLEKIEEMGKKGGEVAGLVRISYIPEGKEEKRVSVTIEKINREKFIKELNISRETLKRLKRGVKEKKVEFIEFKKPNFYAKISNKIFLKYSTKFSNEGKLKKLNSYLRKANMSYLVTTYFSMVLLSTLIAFILGVIAFISLLFFSKISVLNILRNFLVIVLSPVIAFISLYFYPYVEGKSIETKTNQELPFVTIHMAAIAGSGIEPTQIFKIVALGEEYPNTKKEFKKIVNQVNVYGYDLITALKNTARETSSRKLSELLNGIATTIVGGGSLSEFLDKRAESLLFEYKLEKERKTKSAETFMDIYISIVIAAPMIMTLLLILISISGMSIGLSLVQLTVVIVSIVSLINIIFLVFLHLSETGY